MSEVLERFDQFFADFRKSKLWIDMVNTREDSPWHREANVSVHTEMLIDWYKNNLMSSRNETQQMLSLVACLFHDVGKPAAQVVKENAERGVYRSYGGHELISARLWVDYAMTHESVVRNDLRLKLLDVSNVALMLEHHVPFGMKDKTKRKNLKNTFMNRMDSSGHQAWLDFMMCDQHGRISDGQAEKLAAVDAWMEEWKAL